MKLYQIVKSFLITSELNFFGECYKVYPLPTRERVWVVIKMPPPPIGERERERDFTSLNIRYYVLGLLYISYHDMLQYSDNSLIKTTLFSLHWSPDGKFNQIGCNTNVPILSIGQGSVVLLTYLYFFFS